MKFDLKNLANKGTLAVKKHSPEILVFTGIAGVVTSAVMACKATRKLDPVLEAHKENAEAVHRKYKAKPDEHAEKQELTNSWGSRRVMSTSMRTSSCTSTLFWRFLFNLALGHLMGSPFQERMKPGLISLVRIPLISKESKPMFT